MTAKIIDGKAISKQIRAEIAEEVKQRLAKGLPAPGLAVVIVGDDPASHIYVRNKEKACHEAGLYSEKIELPADTTQEKLLSIIDDLNVNPKIHGILVQFPPPEHIDTQAVIERISPLKDVDGFHPYNIGKLAQGQPTLRSCTPYGCVYLLESTGVELTGKDVVIIGASNLAGRPMAFELIMKRCTVTVCRSRTHDLPGKVKQAEIVIAAMGKPEFIKGDWIKEGAIVIDIGINRMEDGKLKGDVEFDVAKERASWITPVPGGVGPMTIAMLLKNTLQAAEWSESEDQTSPFLCHFSK